MVKPERRTRADMVAAAAIAGVVALVAAIDLVDQRRARDHQPPGRRARSPP